MALAGKLAVVTGASGIVGAYVARAFLEAGATVVAPARSQASQVKIEADLGAVAPGKLHVPLADVGSVEGALELGKFVEESGLGPVDHVVSSTGGDIRKAKLTEVVPEDLEAIIAHKVAGHFWLAKALVPLLRTDGDSSYTVVTGLIGEVVPVPDAALRAVANTALYGATVALQAQLKGTPTRVNELRIAAAIRRDDEKENSKFPEVPAFPSTRLAAFALQLATGEQKDSVVRVGPQQLQV